MKEDIKKQPSKFCDPNCSFVKANEFSCRKLTNCWHLKDHNLSPKDIDVTIRGVSHRVTIIGENDVFEPIWYLKPGSLPQMLRKNHEVYAEPVGHSEIHIKTQKEKYDEMKKRR